MKLSQAFVLLAVGLAVYRQPGTTGAQIYLNNRSQLYLDARGDHTTAPKNATATTPGGTTTGTDKKNTTQPVTPMNTTQTTTPQQQQQQPQQQKAAAPTSPAGGGGMGLAPGSSYSGHVTNYQSSDGSGACNYKNMKVNMLRSGIGGNNWHGSLACGMCVHVEPSQGKPIDVYIVNVTEDGDGLDLELASMIAMKGSTGGAIMSKLTVVKCPFSDPIQVEVTAPQALQMTIGRTTVPVVQAEISTGGGGYTPMKKIDPYHWAPQGGAGGGGGTFSLRLTGSDGKTIVQSGLSATAGVQNGNTNF